MSRYTPDGISTQKTLNRSIAHTCSGTRTMTRRDTGDHREQPNPLGSPRSSEASGSRWPGGAVLGELSGLQAEATGPPGASRGLCALTAPLFRSCARLPWTRVCGASAHSTLCLVTVPTKQDYGQEQERTLPLLTSTCRRGDHSGSAARRPAGRCHGARAASSTAGRGRHAAPASARPGGQGRHGQQSRVAGR